MFNNYTVMIKNNDDCLLGYSGLFKKIKRIIILLEINVNLQLFMSSYKLIYLNEHKNILFVFT